MSAEKKVCHAGKHALKEGIQEGHYGIGSHIYTEVVTEEITFPMGVPFPVAVWLGIMAFAVTGRTSVLLAITGSFFRCCVAVRTGVSSVARAGCSGLSVLCGWLQELLFVETKNKKKQVLRFQVPAFRQRKKCGNYAGRIAGSLIVLLFSLVGFILWKRFLGERLFLSFCQMQEKKS